MLDTLCPSLSEPTCSRRSYRFSLFLTHVVGFKAAGLPQRSLSANTARARLIGQMPKLVLPQHDPVLTHLGAMQPQGHCDGGFSPPPRVAPQAQPGPSGGNNHFITRSCFKIYNFYLTFITMPALD